MCNVQTKILIFIKKGERFLIQEKLDFIIIYYIFRIISLENNSKYIFNNRRYIEFNR